MKEITQKSARSVEVPEALELRAEQKATRQFETSRDQRQRNYANFVEKTRRTDSVAASQLQTALAQNDLPGSIAAAFKSDLGVHHGRTKSLVFPMMVRPMLRTNLLSPHVEDRPIVDIQGVRPSVRRLRSAAQKQPLVRAYCCCRALCQKTSGLGLWCTQ
ncbi:hypothetical protein [uncultured Tateyamaria sp.]|uniref:hypothetical protein n=1 Tax=uncultured Tateyamaria sp. TaxID=455651 RepID=UPI0026187B40|nr:hypothetical protein [uncultured Tateyamaria sp.]